MQYAAAELADYLGQVTGGTFTIVNTATGGSDLFIPYTIAPITPVAVLESDNWLGWATNIPRPRWRAIKLLEKVFPLCAMLLTLLLNISEPHMNMLNKS